MQELSSEKFDDLYDYYRSIFQKVRTPVPYAYVPVLALDLKALHTEGFVRAS